ncbi:MAG: hypothetical protein CBD76_00465 [Pelagibacteraceae bacterium TMED216]|nr:MAG: hypothetical protein CBD76_00465 [Pelagibacteraceae bacterium TMED216]|tara:strand:- start:1543 stop:2586 length:1044 start_codon:yes stop_codon:yes gene_type:complete
MIKVKISIPHYSEKDINIFNFTNDTENIFNNKIYHINSKVDQVDYWFVLENVSNTKDYIDTEVRNNNIFYLSSDTSRNDDYFFSKSKVSFFNQFKKVFSSSYIHLDNVINTPPFTNWRLRGDPFVDYFDTSDIVYYKNLNPKKTKLLSVYCTDKQITSIQKVRFEFVKKLKNYFGEDLDWFGSGIKETKSKEDGILNYKYHLVLENQYRHNTFSEKLFDSFLGNSLPIYFGAPNLIDHFNQKSYLQLNLNDYGDSLKKINQIINSDEYEKSYDHLIQAKDTVLEKFNIIKRIDNIIENLEDENATKYEIKRIYNKRYFESNSKTSKLAYSFDKRLLKLSNKLKDKYT